MPGKCCGKPRATKFCPDCGRELEGDAAFELLTHVRTTIKAYETRKTKAPTHRRFRGDIESITREIAMCERMLVKWNRMLQALENLMDLGGDE